ncbi:MAG TPA: DUF5985 family protein [Bryobacteraceae bacterium]|nr:hypothetical protein [Acidobacteriaceae bacterium]
MNAALYIVTCLTMLLCAVLLLRAYFVVQRRLLLWSALCFFGMTLSNLLVALDLIVLRNVDLYTWRLGSSALSMMLLLYGLIWESK